MKNPLQQNATTEPPVHRGVNKSAVVCSYDRILHKVKKKKEVELYAFN